MRRNLIVTTDRFGNPIPQKTQSQMNGSLTTPAVGIPVGISGYVGQDYGYYYNIQAITGTTLCPTGYHIPSEAELDTLITASGGSTIAGKLKETGLTYWITPNTGAESFGNFDLRGAGYINMSSNSTGYMSSFKQQGYLVSNNVVYDLMTRRVFSYNDANGFLFTGGVKAAWPIRCIKD
jgi:uncharacterized protein (TIGR02145 family)